MKEDHSIREQRETPGNINYLISNRFPDLAGNWEGESLCKKRQFLLYFVFGELETERVGEIFPRMAAWMGILQSWGDAGMLSETISGWFNVLT